MLRQRGETREFTNNRKDERLHILTDKWQAVGSVVRTVYNDEDGGHFFVCDCHRRRDGVAEFNTVNAQEVAEMIAGMHNVLVWRPENAQQAELPIEEINQ